jgi:hypothetical protein
MNSILALFLTLILAIFVFAGPDDAMEMAAPHPSRINMEANRAAPQPPPKKDSRLGSMATVPNLISFALILMSLFSFYNVRSLRNEHFGAAKRFFGIGLMLFALAMALFYHQQHVKNRPPTDYGSGFDPRTT